MKIRELLELLKHYDPETEIYMAQPTNDYWKHMKIVPVTNADLVQVQHSAYTESLVENEHLGKMVLTIDYR